MDVLRHTGRAELSSFVGGSPSQPRDGPRRSGSSRPTPRPTCRSRSTCADELYGERGPAGCVDDLNAYVDGINAYIDDAHARPDAKLPAEYAALGKMPTHVERRPT